MARYSYKALDSSGRQVTGEAESSDRKRLLQQLAQKGLKPISVEFLGEQVGTDDDVESMDFFKSSTSRFKFLSLNRSKRAIALEFLKRLHVLLSSGMSIGDAVNLLGKRLSDPQLKELCESVWKRLSEGQTLANALRAEKGGVFAPSTIHLIEAGEASGNLQPILEKVVAYLEEARDVRKNLLSNLSYPIFVLSVAMVVVVILLVFLLPMLQNILDQLGGDLPLITKLLIVSSHGAMKYGPFILGGIAVGVVAIHQWRRSPKGQRTTDLWLLKLPIIGRIYLYSNIFATTSLMATLLGSGVNTTETLRLVERTINNLILRGKFAAARKQIQEGVSMAGAIQRVRYMPDMAMDILTVGENTGNIVTSLNDINKIYREELTKSINILTTTTVALALGGAVTLVAIIALSVVFSILSVGNTVM
jgi:type II secretory pathway component PulF